MISVSNPNLVYKTPGLVTGTVTSFSVVLIHTRI